jgi:hypothetical protein
VLKLCCSAPVGVGAFEDPSQPGVAMQARLVVQLVAAQHAVSACRGVNVLSLRLEYGTREGPDSLVFDLLGTVKSPDCSDLWVDAYPLVRILQTSPALGPRLR